MNQRGLSLVEVLVALAILAVALAAGTRAAGALTSSTERQSQALMAQLCAENELIKLRLSKTYPGSGDQSFTCEQAGMALQGKLSIAPTPNPNFRRVDALVFEPQESGSAASDQTRLAFRITTILSRY